jgi:hypothetical protein
MKYLKFMTCRLAKSVTQEEDKKNLCGKHRSLKFRFWLCIFLLMLTIQVSAQKGVNLCTNSDFTFDKESFLIGTLDDYLGHQQTFTICRDSLLIMSYMQDSAFTKNIKEGYISLQEMIESADEKYQFIDTYCLMNEKKIASLIISLFIDEFPDLRMKEYFPRLAQNAEECISLYSESLTKIIDSYYDYRPSSSNTIFSDTIYSGYLKSEKLRTSSQKLSFLTGAMLRSLYKSESERYYFSMPNSLNKARLCSELLKMFDCKNVVYECSDNYVVGNLVYFEPSETISKLIEKVKTIKENLESDTPQSILLLKSNN